MKGSCLFLLSSLCCGSWESKIPNFTPLCMSQVVFNKFVIPLIVVFCFVRPYSVLQQWSERISWTAVSYGLSFVLIILLYIWCWNHLHLEVEVNCWISLLVKLWWMRNSEWLKPRAGVSLWENGLRIYICFSGVHGQSIFATSFTMQWVSLYFRI